MASTRHLAYLILMGLCLVTTLPLELLLGVRVYARIRLTALSVLPVAVVFSLLDAVAIGRGLWHYNRTYTTGWRLPGSLPIEEAVFFLVIPICGLMTYEAVGRVLRHRRDDVPAMNRRDA